MTLLKEIDILSIDHNLKIYKKLSNANKLYFLCVTFDLLIIYEISFKEYSLNGARIGVFCSPSALLVLLYATLQTDGHMRRPGLSIGRSPHGAC